MLVKKDDATRPVLVQAQLRTGEITTKPLLKKVLALKKYWVGNNIQVKEIYVAQNI